MKGGYILLFLLITALAFASYILFSQIISLNSTPIILQEKNSNPNKNITSYSSGSLQYYPNMKFNHNIITYYIDSSCSDEKKLRIEEALNILEESVSEISFNEIINGDIEITCEKKNTPSDSQGYFIAGEGGPTSVINASLFYIIEKGTVLLFYDKAVCDYPNIELHELLHVFGFGHSENKESIMYPVSSCNQVLTSDIANELKRLYSIENLPDLFFSDISVKKHGGYIDFELRIKNEGLTDADNIRLEIGSISSNTKIDEFDIGSINYGEGKYLKVENLKIPLRVDGIRFEIINGNEIDDNNNIAEFNID